MNEKKLVLLPYGPPPSTPESQAKCYELLLYCDADQQRILDHGWGPRLATDARMTIPPDTLGRFLAYAQRLAALQNNDLQAIVALTQSCPLNVMVIAARRAIASALPVLASALWIIYTDPALDPSFERSALRLGTFDPPGGKLDLAPYWRDESGSEYLVLTPRSQDNSYIRLRARMLAARRIRPTAKSDPPKSLRRERTWTNRS